MAGVLIECLSKSYLDAGKKPVAALSELTLNIADRELLVVVGPSGAGKTTLLRLIAGLEKVSSGTISIGGRVVHDLPPQDREVAMVFQEPALYPHMNVRENLGFGLKLRKFPKTEIAARVGKAADLLGVSSLLERKPQELSGGERQRVSLGRALVLQPKVFLLDEPLSNLDARLRAHMRREIVRVHRALGTTMIYVTHDQTEAMSLATRLAVLQGGRLQQAGPPLSLYERPANLFVATFLGELPMNLIAGRIARSSDGLSFVGDSAGASHCRFELPKALAVQNKLQAEQGVLFGVRPEHVHLTGSGMISAEIESVESLGAETRVYLKVGQVSLVARERSDLAAAIGDKVSLRFELEHGHWFDPATGNRIG